MDIEIKEEQWKKMRTFRDRISSSSILLILMSIGEHMWRAVKNFERRNIRKTKETPGQ
jgi:hypothetical protein